MNYFNVKIKSFYFFFILLFVSLFIFILKILLFFFYSSGLKGNLIIISEDNYIYGLITFPYVLN